MVDAGLTDVNIEGLLAAAKDLRETWPGMPPDMSFAVWTIEAFGAEVRRLRAENNQLRVDLFHAKVSNPRKVTT